MQGPASILLKDQSAAQAGTYYFGSLRNIAHEGEAKWYWQGSVIARMHLQCVYEYVHPATSQQYSTVVVNIPVVS